MKSLIKIFLILLVGGTIVTGCKRDFLNTKPLGEVSSVDVWKDGPLSEAFVTEIYNGLGWGGFNEQMLSSLTDETIFTHAGRGINIITEGTLSPSNLGWIGQSANGSNNYEWKAMYNRIRSCNVGLENLAKATFDDKTLNNRLQGEIHFLRGYFYQQLLRYYGGVPIISRSYGLGEADYGVERDTYEACVNFIIKDCDSAVLLLDGKTLAKGRATKNAALALKSRVLLYAASDLHDMPVAKAKIPTIASATKPELLGYLTSDRTNRWQKAKDAAKAVIDAAGSGYKLNLTAPATADAGRLNYLSIAMGGGSKAPGVDATASTEIIFGRYFTANKDEGAQQQGLYNGPNGYHNWAGNSPIGELVDDYEMMDGTTSTKFDWNNPVHSANPYVNRDPRFYSTIMFDGSDWKPRDKISGNVDPANQIQTGSYEISTGTGTSIIAGLDTRQSTIENWNGSWTGYYTRKFVDPSPDIVDNNTRQFIPWPFFRYTEAVMNYAEACIELGQDAEARTWLNKIRFRAGMPALTESGDALRQHYRNERRIELALEEQRFHDTRRWLIADLLGRTPLFINIKGTLKPGRTVTVYKKSATDYNYTYTPTPDVGLENRKWADKLYYWPINRDEITRNPKLVQNPGYDK